MRLVVVVLPCVPATAMPCFRRISSASISARGTTGMPRSRAATTSGLSAATAVDTTTASAPATFAAAWPIAIATPSRARRARDRALGEVGAGHLVALRREHLGDAAHAGAADADEVDALDLVLHRARPERDADVGDARRRRRRAPSARAAARHREQRVARSSAAASSASRSGGELGLRHPSIAAPASTRNCALALCSSAIAPGSGTMIAPTPDGRELGDGDRAAAADHEVGPRVARRHVVDERHALGRDAGARVGGAQRVDVLLAGLVHDVRARRGGQQRERRRHELVQRRRAEAAADDEQAQRARRARRSAAAGGGSAPIASRSGLPTHSTLRACRPRSASRKAQQDPVGAVGEHAVGESRDRVGVVQHERLAARRRPSARRETTRSRRSRARRRARGGG